MSPRDLEAIYTRRLESHIVYRKQVWRTLTQKYFARYVDPTDTIVDLGCGYGEFINHIACRRKYAIDLNSRAATYLSPDITFFAQDCSAAWPLPDDSLDVVFSSNFFEHLETKQALAKTLAQAFRCLRDGGRLIAMGPNIRFVGGAYWDFWDHHLALTDASMVEALELQGFRVEEVIPRFLPYSMVNNRPAPRILLSLYLRAPWVWRVFGKQFLVFARKHAKSAEPRGLRVR